MQSDQENNIFVENVKSLFLLDIFILRHLKEKNTFIVLCTKKEPRKSGVKVGLKRVLGKDRTTIDNQYLLVKHYLRLARYFLTHDLLALVVPLEPLIIENSNKAAPPISAHIR